MLLHVDTANCNKDLIFFSAFLHLQSIRDDEATFSMLLHVDTANCNKDLIFFSVFLHLQSIRDDEATTQRSSFSLML